MLFILVMYSGKPLSSSPSRFQRGGQANFHSHLHIEGKTPEGIEPLFPGLKLTAYHLQAITLPIGGKHELRVGFSSLFSF